MKIEKLIFALSLFLMLTISFQSCTDDTYEEDVTTNEVDNNLFDTKATPKNQVGRCGHHLYHINSDQISKRQSHAPSLVSDQNLDGIMIYSHITDQVPAFSTGFSWGQALDAAVVLWNAAGSNSCLSFEVTTNPDLADITILGPSDNPNGGLPSDADHVFGWVV